jgi:O-antigen/teichoic acid export membrane protein
VARTQYLVNEKETLLSLRFIVWGLLANVFAGFIFIPLYGPIGAAISILIGQFVAGVLSSFIYRKTRLVGREQLIALMTPWRFSLK